MSRGLERLYMLEALIKLASSTPSSYTYLTRVSQEVAVEVEEQKKSFHKTKEVKRINGTGRRLAEAGPPN